MKNFEFWCYKVLPLVYDDSLSYYEVLCKIVKYINNIIEDEKKLGNRMDELENELNEVQKWIDNFDTSYIEEILKKYIATMIFVEINNAGYIVYNIPDNWNNIEFNTTGVDIDLSMQPEYGHLVLSY